MLEIQKFCEMYKGLFGTKRRWMDIAKKKPFFFTFYISHVPKSNPEFIYGLLFGGIATTTWISCNHIITRQDEE